MAANWTLTIPRRVDGAPKWRLLTLLGTWYRRYQERRALAELDDRLLRDCGLTRSQITREIEKPFWLG